MYLAGLDRPYRIKLTPLHSFIIPQTAAKKKARHGTGLSFAWSAQELGLPAAVVSVAVAIVVNPARRALIDDASAIRAAIRARRV